MKSGFARNVVAVAAALGAWTCAFAAGFSAPDISNVTSYEKGVWTSRVSTGRSGNGWQTQGTRRDPWSFKQQPLTPVNLSLRQNEYLEVALGDGTRLVWETPTKLIRILGTGQRITETSDFPIVQFTPEFLTVTRAVLKEHLAGSGGKTFSAAVLEDGGLVKYTFDRSEKYAIKGQEVWRWGGFRASHAAMYDKANIAMTRPFDLLLTARGELIGWIDPTADTVTVIDGYEAATSQALWNDQKISQPKFTTVTLAERQAIPMSDYVPLVATIMVPGDETGKPLAGKFPTVLMRTPYGRKPFLKEAFEFVSRGYVVISQDVRGRGDSSGFFNAIHDDMRDGSDTLDWIAAQPWSDGNVGMIGPSYLGWVQWQAAATGNPHLKAMISIVPTTTPFGDMPYVNGMFGTGLLTWAVSVGSTPERLADALTKDLNAIATQLPLIDADKRAVGHEIPFWRYWVTHSHLDEYWQQGNVLARQDKIDVPVLHIAGWYDDVLRGTTVAYDMMKANKRPNQHLLLGPWPHAVNTVRSLAELYFGPDAARADMHYDYVRWFDRWLKGVDNKVDGDAPVRYFTMGENKWHTADTWPPKNTTTRKWYLQSNGHASRPEDGARLTQSSPKGQQTSDQYTHDPAKAAPYLVDIRANQLSAPEDYQEVEQRADTLEYTTEAFTQAFEITGESVAELYAQTDQKDTDWVVRVSDVFPDGRSINIIDGYLRARFRNGMEKEELVTPGEVVRYRIPLTWTSHRFLPGHKMRVMIASAAAGAFVVNTNTGNPMATDTEMKIARQTIHHSAQYPSHIEVSVRE